MRAVDFIQRMILWAAIFIVTFPWWSLGLMAVVSFFTGFFMGLTGQ